MRLHSRKVRKEKPIIGYSDIPLSIKTIEAMDGVAKSLHMSHWYVTEMAAVALTEADRPGIQLGVQFTRASNHPIFGFNLELQKHAKSNSNT